MSRAHQIERQMEREEEALSKDLESGAISRADYNEAMRDLQREARAAYAEDVREAEERVRNDWGW
jgi:hypothetical protein